MRTFILSTILILLTCTTLSAQADFLDKGTGGFEFGLGYSSNSPADAFLVALGGTLNGIYEAGLIGGTVSDSYDGHYFVQSSVTFYPTKLIPRQNQIVNFGLRVGGEAHILNPGTLSSDGKSSLSIGGVFLVNAQISETTWFQPALSFAHLEGLNKQGTNSLIGISASIITKISSQNYLRLNPSVSIMDNDQTYSFLLSFILPEISD